MYKMSAAYKMSVFKKRGRPYDAVNPFFLISGPVSCPGYSSLASGFMVW